MYVCMHVCMYMYIYVCVSVYVSPNIVQPTFCQCVCDILNSGTRERELRPRKPKDKIKISSSLGVEAASCLRETRQEEWGRSSCHLVCADILSSKTFAIRVFCWGK